ncbi:MAG: phosphate ABC transporter substrate-binding protein [Ponticaulis sp.]|nr:phosphate ABC transporter substrate-binding protein [Ponticaulis sp.]|tara:strand:+ start:1420 stop:2475 length:1056 start_codon:yes stop_codon:yes gene_type:complete
MRERQFISAVISALSLAVLSGCGSDDSVTRVGAYSSDESRIIIAGSSTVAPFATSAAEYFGVKTEYSTPVVETTGTGGGFKIFCQGNSGTTSSIATASRPIADSETELCAENGVSDIQEFAFGSDGIVFMNALDGPELTLNDREIFQALAAKVPVDGEMVPNPYQYWSEVNPELPNIRIEVYGPPPTSGTRDALVDLALKTGALTFPELEALQSSDPDSFHQVYETIRTDGRWLDAGENDTQIIQSLLRNPEAVGVAGFSYLDQSGDRVKPARIDGVLPSYESILSGDYALSRSLFLYVKPVHLEKRPAVKAFLKEVFSDAAMAEGGYLLEKGLIPPSEDNRNAILSRLEK